MLDLNTQAPIVDDVGAGEEASREMKLWNNESLLPSITVSQRTRFAR